MMRRLGIVAAAIASFLPGLASAQPAAADPQCAGLARLAPDTLGDATLVVTQAAMVAEGTPATGIFPPPPAPVTLPRHCELFGKLAERQGTDGQTYAMRFHLRLPTAWNGRFFFQGGGGSNGVVGNAVGTLLDGGGRTALGLGYAVVSQDSGHDNARNDDPRRGGTATFGWDAEARRNYGFASIGAVTRVAKRLIHAAYGRDPAFSYFVGGSKGGQEAFMAAQRFGREFDGVLAGYPGFRLATAGSAGEMWDDQAFAAVAKAAGETGPDGLPRVNRSFTDADLALAAGAVLDACDALDGLRDGMVFAFAQCTTARVRPFLARRTCAGAKAAACLSPAQVAALVRVFDGARDRQGRLLYATWPWDAGIGGPGPGGYYRGWRMWKLGSYSASANDGINITLAAATVASVFTSPPTPVAADPAALTRYALGVDVTAAEASSHVKWGPRGESSVDFMNADAHDLGAFTSHGGKLLVFHGVSDPVFSINDTIAWLGAVDRVEHGKADRFVRLFAVPGMNHGGGGPTTNHADFFGALVAWTERGVAPTRLVATAGADTAWPNRERPLCAYPRIARYTGGPTESAASFACR